MKKSLFILAMLMLAAITNALAQTQVATLQHGDDISVFYGTNAFVEAHNAAADGDIVTLSSGSFTVPSSITKAITLRGAGMMSDSVSQIEPTIFAESVFFNVDNDSVPLQVEGVLFSHSTYSNGAIGGVKYSKLINPKFTKCSFNRIGDYNNPNMRNAQFVNCMIYYFDFTGTYNTTLINSVVWNPINISTSNTVSLYNSIWGNYANGNASGLSAHNSVVIQRSSNISGANATSTFINCIGIKIGTYSPFGSGYTSGCVTYTSYEEVFETFTGTFSLEEHFILKDEIATGFLGSDGTQVGIHGGFMPYSPRPSYMVLKRCNVANRSTVDGKLSVEIEVITEGE